MSSEASLLDAAKACAECLAAGPLPEVCRACIVGADASPVPPPGLLRYFLVRLQCQMPSLRFGCPEQSFNKEKAGDILESVGGFLRPWNKRAEIVSRKLGVEYGWREDEVQDALRSLTHFVEAASFAYAHASADYAEYGILLSTHFHSEGCVSSEVLGLHSPAGVDCIACAVKFTAGLHGSCLRGDLSASGSREASASGPADDDDEPEAALVPPHKRVPPHVYDQRFSRQRSARVVICDGCREEFRGSGVGSFVAQTCGVLASDRLRLWEMGQLDGRWYCVACWAEYAERPEEEMPEYLGWARRDAKRKEYQVAQQRKPHKIGYDDERFSNPSKHSRVVFCDYRGCLKACKGMNAGFFLNQELPWFGERLRQWQSGSLDMTFYCQRHYEMVTGRPEPASTRRRREERALHQDQHGSSTQHGGRSSYPWRQG